MARQNFSYEKRQREIAKKKKKAEKEASKAARRAGADPSRSGQDADDPTGESVPSGSADHGDDRTDSSRD